MSTETPRPLRRPGQVPPAPGEQPAESSPDVVAITNETWDALRHLAEALGVPDDALSEDRWEEHARAIAAPAVEAALVGQARRVRAALEQER